MVSFYCSIKCVIFFLHVLASKKPSFWSFGAKANRAISTTNLGLQKPFNNDKSNPIGMYTYKMLSYNYIFFSYLWTEFFYRISRVLLISEQYRNKFNNINHTIYFILQCDIFLLFLPLPWFIRTTRGNFGRYRSGSNFEYEETCDGGIVREENGW